MLHCSLEQLLNYKAASIGSSLLFLLLFVFTSFLSLDHDSPLRKLSEIKLLPLLLRSPSVTAW